jgi:threonine/homoserine/homoserine lactone efflux protein
MVLAWVIPILWGLVYCLMKALGKRPDWMVIAGGFVTSIILLVVLFAAIVFKARRSTTQIRTGRFYEVAFWASAVMILFVGVWAVYKTFI